MVLSGAVVVVVNWQSELVRFCFSSLKFGGFYVRERSLYCGVSVALEAGSLKCLIQVFLYLLSDVPRYNV